MSLQSELNWIQSELLKVKDPDLIRAIKSLIKYGNKQSNKETDWWDKISEEERASIERGIDQAENGETKAHADVMKKYEKWL